MLPTMVRRSVLGPCRVRPVVAASVSTRGARNLTFGAMARSAKVSLRRPQGKPVGGHKLSLAAGGFLAVYLNLWHCQNRGGALKMIAAILESA